MSSRWRREGVESTSTSSILHPEKIPKKKSKAQDGMNVGKYYYGVSLNDLPIDSVL
jgi:hypothetical protein